RRHTRSKRDWSSDVCSSDLTLNGQKLDPSEVYSDNRLELSGLAEENVLQVMATLPYSRTGEGLHRFVDPADDRVYLYTQFEVPEIGRASRRECAVDSRCAYG